MRINILETTDTHMEPIDHFDMDTHGTEQEQIAQAIEAVTERGYVVIPDSEGGCNELTAYSDDTPPCIAVTVEPIAGNDEPGDMEEDFGWPDEA